MSKNIHAGPPFAVREAYRKAQAAHDKKIKWLIDAARAGNGEFLARYIERNLQISPFREWSVEGRELQAFLAELVRKLKPARRPQSSAAFYRNRSIAWFAAKRLLYKWYIIDLEMLQKGSLQDAKLILTEKVIARTSTSLDLDRTTVQRAWKKNPDFHDALTVEMLRSLGPDAWKDPT
jgi:hypothetical protein